MRQEFFEGIAALWLRGMRELNAVDAAGSVIAADQCEKWGLDDEDLNGSWPKW